LVAANGTSANQVLHIYEAGVDIQRVQRDNLKEMDEWLTAIIKDTAPANSLEKVIRNRPASVTDGCYTNDGQKTTDMKCCAEMFPAYANPRLNAGMPIASTMLKYGLKPIDKKDYSRALTDAQIHSSPRFHRESAITTKRASVCDHRICGCPINIKHFNPYYGLASQTHDPPITSPYVEEQLGLTLWD
jgi:hypothetical protein